MSPLTIANMGLNELCDLAAASEAGKAAAVSIEQLEDAVGGISNLFLELAIRERKPEIQFRTRRGFISESVPAGVIVQEVANCTGVDHHRAELIVEALESALKTAFEREGLVDVSLEVTPLGIFEWIGNSRDEYAVAYRDPMVTRFRAFLV